MKITTTYKELPKDVQSAVSELNAMVNVSYSLLMDDTNPNNIIMTLDRLEKMNEILGKLLSD